MRSLLKILAVSGMVFGCSPEPTEQTVGAITPSSVDEEAERRPSIVLILADDLGIGDTSVYGSQVIDTPNIDALAGRGVRFTQGYVSHPVCSPSRAGLMTGRYQQRHGWEFNPAGRDVDAGMSTAEQTLADVMRAEGYTTGMVGKWHLGYQGPHHPLSRGFDEFFGLLAGGSIFIDPATQGVESMGTVSAIRQDRIAVSRGLEKVEVTDYLTDVFTEEAVGFIERHRNEPFFLYLSHTTPHTPLQATAKYLDRYRHIEDKATRIYAAMVSSLDDSVGAVVEKLREIGRLENTLIVFASDNGCAGYIRGACSNAPHSGFKRYHQEGGVRVPFILSWPAHLPSGSVYEHPVITLDLLATFSAAGGGSATTEDSVNLLPYLTGTATGAPHDHLYWRSGPTRAIRDDRWKLIQYSRSLLTAADLRADGRLEPPAEGWPVEPAHGWLTLLYDLNADPGETENLAAEHPEIVERLRTAHDGWHDELQETAILPGVRSTLADMHGETVQLIF
jgi:arylsulfatase A-like enzyme